MMIEGSTPPPPPQQVGADVEVALPDAKSEFGLNKWTVGTGYGSPTYFGSVTATNGKKKEE